MNPGKTHLLGRPRAVRIFRGAEFQLLRERGRAVHGPYFTLVGVRREEGVESRLGVVTSRRVGNAVERNRVRRRLRELHRLSRPDLVPGWWLVLIARRAGAEATWEELRTEWLRLARKLSILPAP